jgi:hypothetical protein
MFQYTIALEELSRIKTLKAREEFIRKYSSALADFRWKSINDSNYTEIKLLYKLTKISFDSWNGTKDLPAFIGSGLDSMESHIIQYLIKSTDVSFNEYTDIFEFTRNITIDTDIDLLLNFVKSIGSNKLPFRVTYNIFESDYLSNLLEGLRIQFCNCTSRLTSGLLVELEILREELGTTYTVLEELLSMHYDYLNHVDTKESTLKKAVERVDKIEAATKVMINKLKLEQ